VGGALCWATCAAWVWSFADDELEAFENKPVTAAVPARLATITTAAAVAISGCSLRERGAGELGVVMLLLSIFEPPSAAE
jgi:hypothetical protein